MSKEDLAKKITGDLDEVLASVRTHKGEVFHNLLITHLNFRSLATALDMHSEDPGNEHIWAAVRHMAVLSTAQAMGHLFQLSKMKKEDAEEIIQWGQRVNKMIQKNIDQFKAS